jgi:hypothetical protein
MTREFKSLAFFPADHAEALGGKLFVHGGYWGRLNFPVFPHALPHMTLAVVLEVPFAAYHAQHHFSIGMEDADGKALPLTVEGQFQVGAPPDIKYGDPTVMPLAIPLNGLVFERPGRYIFTLSVDGEEIDRYAVRAYHVAVPVQLNLAPPGAPPESQAG